MPRKRSLPPHLEIRKTGYYWRRRLPRSLRDRDGMPVLDPEKGNSPLVLNPGMTLDQAAG